MTDPTPEPPTNVRVVDRVTTVGTPVDTVFDHTDDEGRAMFRIVNLPEWFNPRRHTIEVDTIPGKTGLMAPLPRGALPEPLLQVQDQFNDMSRELFYTGTSAFFTRVIVFLALVAIAATYILTDPVRAEGWVFSIGIITLVLIINVHYRCLVVWAKLYRRITRGRTHNAR